ncbi:uncharacterized protein LOC142352225 [Convolutriloba macropyga]|uniref:uncharacterized protein LOC142352225 n=1 Tax=Convolutriloba macropyga TaxID=536237 RepID=UPI003F524485
MGKGENVKLVCCVSACVLALMAVLSCMLGHAGGIVVFKGSTDIQLGLWTLDIDGNQSYDLDFGKELNLIPEVYRAAFELEQGAFQSKANSARVFLLLSHFSAVVSFFSFVWFLLDIFHGTKGAVTLVGVNFAHVVLLVISCACLASGYEELANVDGPGWGGVLIWVGFALSLLCLVISLVAVAADKVSSQQRQSYNADGETPAVASSNGSPRSSVPDHQHPAT